MTTPQPQPKARRRLLIEPPEGGRLEQLLIVNKKAHDAAAEADEAEADSKLAIKTFLLSMFEEDPDQVPDAFDIAADPHGRYPGYTMTFRDGSRVDTKLLAVGNPAVYQEFLRPIQPAWELREASVQRRRRG